MRNHYRSKPMWIAAFVIWIATGSYAAGEVATISLDQPGQILAMNFNLSKCEVIHLGLRFSTKGLSRAEELRLIGNGTYRSDTKEPVNPGVIVPLRIRVVKTEATLSGSVREAEIDSWEYKTRGVSSFSPVSERTASRDAGAITLPRGKYRVEVSLPQRVPELGGIPVSFWLGSSSRENPDRDKCSSIKAQAERMLQML